MDNTLMMLKPLALLWQTGWNRVESSRIRVPWLAGAGGGDVFRRNLARRSEALA